MGSLAHAVVVAVPPSIVLRCEYLVIHQYV